MSRKNGYIYTDNTKLAAYLMCRRIRFVKITKSDVKKDVKVFVFENSGRARLERARFLNRLALCEPNEFMERYRDLRSLVKGERMLKEALKGG